jgi:uncharacterized membrane protein
MNQAHVHLLTNHFPIILPIVSLIIVITAFMFKSELMKRLAYALFALGALFTFVAMQSGEGAEEIVEGIAGITHDVIHEHEEKAETFALLSYVLGLLSLIALWASWKKQSWSNYAGYLTVVISIVVISVAHNVGKSGGDIRHPEINQSGAVEHNEHHEE